MPLDFITHSYYRTSRYHSPTFWQLLVKQDVHHPHNIDDPYAHRGIYWDTHLQTVTVRYTYITVSWVKNFSPQTEFSRNGFEFH